ncbi:PilZ domain-containing protein [Desulfopila sp. IMCC35008]|uniref:PilZ domain-containing protein n=1 Tax=Desulfopila sp. IMCC35008 TaxID=2653858 RepID=UPI0013D79859|nr:PilZ domain-containing protein [Desulfopila sp. IMCC35008]
MTDSSLESLVKSMQDGQEGIVTLQNKAGDKLNFDCVYKESIAPNFFIKIASGAFPTDIDESAPFTFSVIGTTSSIINAKCAEVLNKKTIELTASKSIDPASLREYFRVDIRTQIILSYTSPTNPSSASNWVIKGTTLDLSATGVLALFPSECPNVSNIKIELALSNPSKRVHCFGHLVRTKHNRSGRWHAALHFDQIDNNVRDDIITNCLWEQRRQLRENIQTSK